MRNEKDNVSKLKMENKQLKKELEAERDYISILESKIVAMSEAMDEL